jgi:hypothetical protein
VRRESLMLVLLCCRCGGRIQMDVDVDLQTGVLAQR